MAEIKAIETYYNGDRFRSRIEARWACFFHALEIEYVYEPEGYRLPRGGCYLPDFWIDELNTWIEIKGQPAKDDEMTKAKMLSAGTKKPVVIFEGQFPPDGKPFWGQSFGGSFRTGGALYGKATYDGLVTWAQCPRMGIIELVSRVPNDDEYDAETWPTGLIRAAYTAARQARFEHGESGAPRTLKAGVR